MNLLSTHMKLFLLVAGGFQLGLGLYMLVAPGLDPSDVDTSGRSIS